jgi:hypothetical protein
LLWIGWVFLENWVIGKNGFRVKKVFRFEKSCRVWEIHNLHLWDKSCYRCAEDSRK